MARATSRAEEVRDPITKRNSRHGTPVSRRRCGSCGSCGHTGKIWKRSASGTLTFSGRSRVGRNAPIAMSISWLISIPRSFATYLLQQGPADPSGSDWPSGGHRTAWSASRRDESRRGQGRHQRVLKTGALTLFAISSRIATTLRSFF